LGQHRKPSRIRLPQAAPAAAVAAPTLVGVAAAFLSQQVPAAPLAAGPSQTAPRSAELDAAYVPDGMSTAQLVSATRVALLSEMRQAWQARSAKPEAALPTTYTVQPGDSLSAIAARFYHNQAAWPVLYWRNRGEIRWADDIDVGQVLRIPAEPATIPAPPAELSPPAITTTAAFKPKHASTAPVVAQSAPAPAPAAPAPAPAAPAPAAPAPSGPWPGGAFGNCVVERESGGNPDVWNASGHWGLYQFSESTWIEYGGSAASFGNASVAQQEAVFMNALAQGGEFNWAPYDGC
jgi:pyruvate dehydrogenase E2 component (dihydrolipoamide acetyltransferase)